MLKLGGERRCGDIDNGKVLVRPILATQVNGDWARGCVKILDPKWPEATGCVKDERAGVYSADSLQAKYRNRKW